MSRQNQVIGNSVSAEDVQQAFKSIFKTLINEDYSVGGDIDRYMSIQQHALSKYMDFSVATDIYILSSNLILKLVSTISYQIFIFHRMIALKNYQKCFLFHLKSSFRSGDIQIFVFWSSPLFCPVSNCFRG